jgi:hypothetical protein
MRVLGNSYLLLIRDGHYDLASLCGSELFETGKAAAEIKDGEVVDSVILYFNTLLRYGINHGLKSKENRNVYNMIFQYSRLIHFFIESGDIDRTTGCIRFLAFYGNEIHKLTSSEPFLAFLVDAFVTELEKLLVAIYEHDFPREVQRSMIADFNEFNLKAKESMLNSDDGRVIQITLCLFYLSKNESEFLDLTVRSLLKGIEGQGHKGKLEMIAISCGRLEREEEEFWEDTDQGNMNIFYTPNKDRLSEFKTYLSSKVEETDDLLPKSKLN